MKRKGGGCQKKAVRYGPFDTRFPVSVVFSVREVFHSILKELSLKDIYALSLCCHSIRDTLFSPHCGLFLESLHPVITPPPPFDTKLLAKYNHLLEILEGDLNLIKKLKEGEKVDPLEESFIIKYKISTMDKNKTDYEKVYFSLLWKVERFKDHLRTQEKLRNYLYYLLYRKSEEKKAVIITKWMCGYCTQMEEADTPLSDQESKFKALLGKNFAFPPTMFGIYSIMEDLDYQTLSFLSIEKCTLLVKEMLQAGLSTKWIMKHFPLIREEVPPFTYYTVNCQTESPFWESVSLSTINFKDKPTSKKKFASLAETLLYLCSKAKQETLYQFASKSTYHIQPETKYKNKERSIQLINSCMVNESISLYYPTKWDPLHPPHILLVTCSVCKEPKMNFWDKRCCHICAEDSPFILNHESEDEEFQPDPPTPPTP
eukprot:TRINITY_DN6335_c0_g1_i1.p1 TRINITY_DN6335_c0_g1~~TRINITY_DN6335_c0_g1_i1.p1  ORF type:complete len:430 (+),score=95.24 TRINITY_DN6335_c0_g1_i1:28-1317(+)